MAIEADLNTLKTEVVDCYRRYLDAFLADDVNAIDALIRYPLTYIGDGEVRTFDSYPIKPSDLMREKGWHTSAGLEYEVVGISRTKAHVILRSGARLREDDSKIEDIFAFYAWTRTDDGWKMFAVSDIVVPA
jgi:hypothetical protein